MKRTYAVLVAVLVITGCTTGQGVGSGTPAPASLLSSPPTAAPTQAATPAPTASPAYQEGPLAAGPFVLTPFETAPYAGIRVTMTVPDGWAAAPISSLWLAKENNGPPDGAGLVFTTGGEVLSDPCLDGQDSYIRIGPTVADFVDAVATHPLLDTTPPVDIELAGYSGKYFDLQVPADISMCDVYRPWEWLYAQGPSHRWHVWVLDVDGLRVVVQSTDYAGTSAQRQAELKAIVASIRFGP
jgi:hypothetical protein